MMKKLCSLLLLISCICSLLLNFTSCGKKHDAEDEYLGYDLLPGGTFEVCAKDPERMPFDVVIPETVDGIKVTQIARKGFKGCKQILSVSIPATVKDIKGKAFQDCESLKYVYINGAGKDMASFVFKDCTSLEAFYFNGTNYEWNKMNNRWSWFWNTSINNSGTEYIFSDTPSYEY